MLITVIVSVLALALIVEHEIPLLRDPGQFLMERWHYTKLITDKDRWIEVVGNKTLERRFWVSKLPYLWAGLTIFTPYWWAVIVIFSIGIFADLIDRYNQRIPIGTESGDLIKEKGYDNVYFIPKWFKSYMRWDALVCILTYAVTIRPAAQMVINLFN